MPRKADGGLLLLNLPDDVVLLILRFCDVHSLGSLAQTCQRFRRIVDEDVVWLKRYRKLTLSHLQPKLFCRDFKSVKDEFHVGKNWNKGHYKYSVLYKSVLRQMPRLKLTSDSLWFTHKACIRQYKLKHDGTKYDRPAMVYKAFSADISCFARSDHAVVAGGTNGSMAVWFNNDLVMNEESCHNNTIHSVDIHQTVIVTGGRDNTVKVWNLEHEDVLRRIIDVGDRTWSVSFSPDGQFVVTGTAGLNGVKPLSLWDIETGTQLGSPCTNYRRGAGILGLQFDTPHTILSCGYDSAIRLWDLRRNKCVGEWHDPHDNTVYCVQSNHHYAIVSGTCRHGLARLWDKRMINPTKSLYIGNHNSPVYSLAYNRKHLYAGLERNIALLNFGI